MSEEVLPYNGPSSRVVTDILYCAKCSMPPEYCSYGPCLNDCKAWLQVKHPETFQKLWPEEEISGQLAVSSTTKAKGGSGKGGKKKSQNVIIKRVERNKRKYVTTVYGLELHGIELKKAAKLFANKFATGSSVTKNPQGQDEIVLQGDLQDDIYDLILKTYPEIPEEVLELTEGKR